MNVLIVEDHPSHAKQLLGVSRRLTGGAVTRHAASLGEARRLSVQGWQPALVLLDLSLPDGSGLELMAAGTTGDAANVAFCDAPDAAVVGQAVAAGAHGVVLKGTPSELLVPILELIVLGGRYIPPEVVAGSLCGGSAGAAALTPRQRQVLQLVARGLSNRAVARMLGLTEGTVKAHLNAVYRLLGARNRREAVRMARLDGHR